MAQLIATRKGILAIVKETTEGTPKWPASAADLVALQLDFDLTPDTDSLENEELRPSIGKAESILGAENPKATYSHYARGSGVEGQAPDYGALLEAAFGDETVVVTEDSTAAGSTTTAIAVADGSVWERGQPMLIKDPINGYRVRVVNGVSGDDLDLSFKVPTAPPSGVDLGKAVFYTPEDEDHPSLTLVHYVGNGGAIRLGSGFRVTELSIDFSAGELINMTASLEGLEFFANPIEITTGVWLDWTDQDGTWSAAVTAKTYKHPHALAAALQSAMAAANPNRTPSVTYSDTDGKFKIKTTGTTLSLLWNSGSHTATTIGGKLGFVTASDDTGTAAATGYTSDNAQSWAAPYNPSFDDATPNAAKANEVMIGDQDDYLCFGTSKCSWKLGLTRKVNESVCAESGRDGSIISAREVTFSGTVPLKKHDVDLYRRYQESDDVRVQYTWGKKIGGNWVPGATMVLYMQPMKVTSWKITDDDGVATLEFELTGFVSGTGEGEVYLGQV